MRRYDLLRDPPCHRCGGVDPAPGYRDDDDFHHVCNPTMVQAMQLGATAIENIGRGIRDAFASLTAPAREGSPHD